MFLFSFSFRIIYMYTSHTISLSCSIKHNIPSNNNSNNHNVKSYRIQERKRKENTILLLEFDKSDILSKLKTSFLLIFLQNCFFFLCLLFVFYSVWKFSEAKIKAIIFKGVYDTQWNEKRKRDFKMSVEQQLLNT